MSGPNVFFLFWYGILAGCNLKEGRPGPVVPVNEYWWRKEKGGTDLLLDAKQAAKARLGKGNKWRRGELQAHLLYLPIMSHFTQRPGDLQRVSIFIHNGIQWEAEHGDSIVTASLMCREFLWWCCVMRVSNSVVFADWSKFKPRQRRCWIVMVNVPLKLHWFRWWHIMVQRWRQIWSWLLFWSKWLESCMLKQQDARVNCDCAFRNNLWSITIDLKLCTVQVSNTNLSLVPFQVLPTGGST